MTKNISVKTFYKRCGIMGAILVALFFAIVMSSAASLIVKLSLLLMVLLLGLLCFVMIWFASSKTANFSKNISSVLDEMISGKDDIVFELYEETVTSKMQSKLKQLYEVMLWHTRQSENERIVIQSLVSDISHQVKTPMANIKMYNDILMDRPVTAEQQKDFYRSISEQIDRLDFLIKAMVKMSRLETGILKLMPTGIPIGLLLGYGSGLLLLPLVLSTTNYKAEYVAPMPLIFIAATFLTYVTVSVSCRKPAKAAAGISPIVAVTYTGTYSENIKSRASRKGNLIRRMAVSNLVSNKKKTIMIVVSYSLSIVLLNSILTYTNSFQPEIYVERRLASDYAVSDVYNGRLSRPMGSGIHEALTEQIRQAFPVESSGSVFYYTPKESDVSDMRELLANITAINKAVPPEKTFMQLYGFEQFPLSLCDVIEGDLDLEKFATGKYVIEFASYSDNMEVAQDEYQFSPGDKLSFECGGKKQEYEVLALVACRSILTSGISIASSTSLMLPAETFALLYPHSLPIRYLFNADSSSFDNIDQWLKAYAGNSENGISYTSRSILTQEFNDIKYTYVISGGILSLLFAIIGVLNFINVIVISILSRQQDFSVMQSVGMTKTQTIKLILCEGFLYVIWSFLLAAVVSIAISLLLIRPMAAGTWYCEYQFTLVPALAIFPFYAVIALLVPYQSIKVFFKKSIVDNLRNA